VAIGFRTAFFCASSARLDPRVPSQAHNTNTKIFLKKAGRGQRKAVLQHSPYMPYGDCLFSIAGGGVVDAVDA